MTPCLLDSHKPAELLLLEICANGEVIIPRTYVCRKAVVIEGLLGRHGGRNWDGRMVKK